MRDAQSVMADLASSGLTPTQIALVIELSAAVAAEASPAIDKAANNKRAYDREYRRTHRKSRTTSYESHDTPSPNERDILTPTREKPKPSGLVKNCGKGVRLSADWEPRPLSGKAAQMVAAWHPGELERELAKFKNYWLAKGANAARTDWQRTWVNWLINADERKPQHGQPASNVSSLRGTRPDPALDLLRAARAAEDCEDRWRTGTSLPAIGTG
jgi:hypothetical protein